MRALGALLWELIAGQAYGAFTGPISNTSRPLALPAGLPEGLDTVLARALIRDPSQRFRSAGELATALRRFTPSRRAGRRALAALLGSRVEVARVQEQQTQELRAAARMLMGQPATTEPEAMAKPRFRVRHWPLPWAAAGVACALGGLHLFFPEVLQGLFAPAVSDSAARVTTVSAPPLSTIVVTPLPPRSAPAGPEPTTPLAVHDRTLAEQTQARVAPPRPPRRRPGASTEQDLLARSEGLLEAAEARFQWRDLEGAERLVNEALMGVPDSPRGHYLHGLILLTMDKAGDAARAFERALAADPGFTDALAKLRIAEERARTEQAR